MNEAPAARPTVTKSPLRVLLLPGWLDSGPGHWQTLWESQHGDTRVVQSDWLWPKRGDWMARLEEVLLEDERPVLLAAHSRMGGAFAAHRTGEGRAARGAAGHRA
jgi:predicted alpha/beta hydrolase family esterase